MGRVGRGVSCSSVGCSRNAARSLSSDRVKSTSIKVASEAKRLYLCDEHYKEWKKEARKSGGGSSPFRDIRW